MNHVNNLNLKSCIYKPWSDFALDVQTALNDPDAIVDLNGTIHTEKPVDPTTTLAKYYGVKIIESIHADDSEYVGIWIAYEN